MKADSAATQAESAAAQAIRTDEKMQILIEMMRQQQAQQAKTNKNSKKRDKKDKRFENVSDQYRLNIYKNNCK